MNATLSHKWDERSDAAEVLAEAAGRRVAIADDGVIQYARLLRDDETAEQAKSEFASAYSTPDHVKSFRVA